MALLEASGIGKNFGDTKVLKDISLTLEQGEALAIIGSSGSGKTTLLRCLNFLERPDTGIIKVNGETMWDAADPATQRESEIRKNRGPGGGGGGGGAGGGAFRRSAAARGHCPRTGSAPGHSLLRRADLGPRPGADRRGAARPARPCRPQDHHDHRHPRDALCP